MDLNTFGALLRFALELEETAVRFYEEAAKAAQGETLRHSFAECAEAASKNQRTLERVRREQVNEMLLESIEGLRDGDYQVGAAASAGMGDGELTSSAAQLEAGMERFYRNAADRLSIPEVVRSFARLADGHARNRSQLGTTRQGRSSRQ